VNIIFENYYMLIGKYIFVIVLSLFVIRNFRGACSCIEMMKGYMVRESLESPALQHNRKTISDFVKRAYLAYFKVMLGDQDKTWAPHIVCKPCVEHLLQWTKKSRKSLRFAIPMVWREPKDPCKNCYFCVVKTKGINRKNRNSVTYPNIDSAMRPIPHSEELPVPVYEGLPQLESSLSSEEEDVSIDSNNTLADNDFPPSLLSPQIFSQGEVNYLDKRFESF